MPEGMDFETASKFEPAAVAVHAVNRACIRNGADGVIMGAGPIGLLTMQAFKAAGGGQVLCVDIAEKRLEIASKLGADKVLNPLKNEIPQNTAEYVFDTSGSAAVASQLFSIARAGGVVIQVGWPNGNMVNMNIADFLDKELNYLGVNRYANAFPAQYAGWQRKNSNRWITSNRFPLRSCCGTFHFAAENAKDVIKVIIYND